MSEDLKPLPVAGYTSQSAERIALANEGKQLEERYLRWLDRLLQQGDVDVCPRNVALARTNIQTGAMWAIRSIFQPTRISLPEDEA
jgi:hypothetical protein